jgi:hypothetical protein
MTALSSLSDCELVTRLSGLVAAERQSTADVIEHLVEVERRRLYLSQRVGSLYGYCMKELGYDEDAALKRNRVAKLAVRLPQVLDELRAGTLHLTGLFLLASHLTEDNAAALLAEARGKSRRQLEELIARWFPRPDVPASIEPLPATAVQLALGAANAPVDAQVATPCSGSLHRSQVSLCADSVADFDGEKFRVTAADDLPARRSVVLDVSAEPRDRQVSLQDRRVLAKR